jgi:hypothetical protein
VFATVLIDDDEPRGLRRLDAYTRSVYGISLEDARAIQAMTAGPAEHVAAHLMRFVGAGAEYIVVRLAALDLSGQRDQLHCLGGMTPLLGLPIGRPVERSSG